MARTTEQQIEATLTAAHELVDKRERRRSAVARPLASAAKRHSADARTALAASFAAQHGFPSGSFATLQARTLDESARAIENARQEVIAEAPSRLSEARAAIARRRALLEALVAAPATSPIASRILLTKPFIIWPSVGLQFSDTHYEAWNSWAKVLLSTSGEATRDLTFYWLWENPSEYYTAVNIDTWVMVHGFALAATNGGVLNVDGQTSFIQGDVTLHVMEWWNQPPTEPALQSTQSAGVVSVLAQSNGFFDTGDVESATVFNTFDLRCDQFVMPPHGVGVFEVVLHLDYYAPDGSVEFNLSSGDLEVLNPFLMIEVLTMPGGAANDANRRAG
jgi:hypothetical protein